MMKPMMACKMRPVILREKIKIGLFRRESNTVPSCTWGPSNLQDNYYEIIVRSTANVAFVHLPTTKAPPTVPVN